MYGFDGFDKSTGRV